MINTFLDFKIFPTPETEKMTERVIGNNARKVLIVFQESEDTAELLDFLQKITTAIKINLAQDTLTLKITAAERYSFIELTKQHQINHIVLFGVSPSVLGLHFDLPLYWVARHQERFFLLADSLELIQKDKTRKAALWSCLQEMFL